MSYDIQGKTARAEAAYQAALERLETARAIYDQGPKAEYTAALEQQTTLSAKIAGCRADAKTAEEEFKKAFEAAGYERTTAVRQALGRKNDALAMAEELEAALAHVEVRLSSLLLDASPKADSLRSVYQTTCEAYGRWKAYEAMGESSNNLKQAIALATKTIPHGYDSLGRPVWSTSEAHEELRRCLAFMWDGLLQMAFEQKDPLTLPFARADISPLKASDLLTPAQMVRARHQVAAALA